MIYKREILTQIRKWIPRDETIILTGPRQSGKTTLLKIIERELNDLKEKVHFINLEDLEIVEFLNKTPANLFKLIGSGGRAVVLIDEIQYLKNPTNFLKLLYDDFRDKVKLIVSGSSAFYLDKRFKDSLAGRKKLFHILSLSFTDFLVFKQREELKDIFYRLLNFDNVSEGSIGIIERRELNNLLEDYMIWGGYPKVALEDDREMRLEILTELVNSYIKKDIVESETRHQEKFLALLKILSSQSGSLFNGNEMANTLGLSTTTIGNYLYIMQKSFHIKLIKPFFKNIRKEITRMPKVYFYDTGLRNKLINNFDPLTLRLDKGELFENFCFKLLSDIFGEDSLKFWRSQSQSEVDFILESERKAVEVKYNASTFRLKKYLNFLNSYSHLDFFLFYRDGQVRVTDERITPKRI